MERKGRTRRQTHTRVRKNALTHLSISHALVDKLHSVDHDLAHEYSWRTHTYTNTHTYIVNDAV